MTNDMETYDISIFKGDTFEFVFYYEEYDCDDEDGIPVNLSNVSTVSSSITDPTTNLVIVNFTAAVTNAAAGEVIFTLSPSQSALLEGSSTSIRDEKIGSYFVRLNYDDGTVETILMGDVYLTSLIGA